jgi:hypothetical protein
MSSVGVSDAFLQPCDGAHLDQREAERRVSARAAASLVVARAPSMVRAIR